MEVSLRQLLFLRYCERISRRKLLLLLAARRRHERKLVRLEREDDWEIVEVFSLDRFTNREFFCLFRFRKADFARLLTALRIPEIITTKNGNVVSGEEGVCIFLRRMAYPNRWIELRRLFGRSESSLSRIFYAVLNHINFHFKWLLRSCNQTWLREENFENFVDSISSKGGTRVGCFGFIDGTARAICRPKYHQRACFSGHKRFHCVKWQSVVTPNGLICNLFGGVRGNMHDARLLRESKILGQLRQKFAGFEHDEFCMYGDSGYGKTEFLETPHSRARCLADPLKTEENYANSAVRQSVEWNFKDIIMWWAYVDFKKRMKLFQVPVNKIYRVAVILSNCKACLKPNQTSLYFNCAPPSLEEYLASE